MKVSVLKVGFRVPLPSMGELSDSMLLTREPLIEMVRKGGTTHTTPVLTSTTFD